MSLLLGNLVGLGSALAWALTTIIMRPLLAQVGLGSSTAVRFIVSAALFLVIGVASGQATLVLSLSGDLYLLLLTSALASLLIGDSAYFLASRRIGVARALPISMSYPLLTALVAVFFLGEPASWALWTGAVLIVGGATLLGLPADEKLTVSLPGSAKRWDVLSIALAVFAAVGWAGSSLLLRLATDQLDPIAVNVVRMFFAAAISVVIAVASPRVAGAWPTGRWMFWTVAAGVGTVLSSLLFVLAISMAGAARASLLNAAAPLFAAPIARYALAEPISRRTLAGIVGTVVGVMLLI